MNIYLAIPNYNMGSELKRLLPTVLDRGYKHIYVLDDCSTDDSKTIVKNFGSAVTFSQSSKNIGAGATRNRILDFQTKGIVHFLDADMELKGTGDITQAIEAAFARHSDTAVIGFRVLNPDGSQYEWNFGPRMRPVQDTLASGSWRLHKRLKNKTAKDLIQKYFTNQWQKFWTVTHPEDAEHEHQVDMVVECNMAARLEDFARVGGFDKRLRFHEIHSLGHKLESLGRQIWYIPEVVARKHNEVQVRPRRNREYRRGVAIVTAKRLTRRYKT
jgi:GT2 family glycosyltransferase